MRVLLSEIRCCFLISLLTSAVYVFGTNVSEVKDDTEKHRDGCLQYSWLHAADGPPNEGFTTAECHHENGDGSNITCINGIENQWLNKAHNSVKILTISSWPTDCISPKMISNHFPLLEDLKITNSSIITFTEDFSIKATSLTKLSLNDLTNLTLRPKLISRLPSLKELDLRGNKLSIIHPDFISSSKTLERVFLIDNRWNCSHEDLQWLAYLTSESEILAKSRIADYKQLTCQGNMYPGKPLHIVMNILKLLKDECPDICSCTLSNLVRNPEGQLVPLATVDCRYKGLTAMPTNLPSITTILLLHGNNISELNPLVQNSIYRKISDVYLDDNLLSSVRPLEGSDWIMSFRLLSLRGNNLTKLPIYFFDYAFRHNINATRVFLGDNPWKCNCYFTPKFQDLLLKYKSLIGDLHDIRCKEIEHHELSQVQVITISRSLICRNEENTMETLDIVNIFLACLIIIVISKFGYDYYWFKKTGRLPWISTKIP